jgi:hypothetical protein
MHSPDNAQAGSSLEISADRRADAGPRRTSALGRWAIHPLLLAVYPILAIFAHNAREVRLHDLGRITVAVLVGMAATWLVLALFFRDWRKAGLLTSAAAGLFFTFGLTRDVINSTFTSLSLYWVRTHVRVPAAAILVPECVLLAALAYLVAVKLKNVARPTAFLNVFATILIIIPLGQAIQLKSATIGRRRYYPTPFRLGAMPARPARPDIYYIILDGYARADVMKSIFNFDNGPFLDRLKRLGFYIARQSTANHCQTPLCLSASLNAIYIDDLVKGLGPDQTELADLIGRSNVVASLKPLGYKFVSFATGFDPTEHPEADAYLSPFFNSNGFERLVIDITPLQVIWPDPRQLDRDTLARERTLYALDHLSDVARDPAPTFTFAHILCPHPPFVFGEHGENVGARYANFMQADGDRDRGRFRNPAQYCEAYRGQSVFLTSRVEQTIERILAASPQPPIIIIQSDHGSELHLDMRDVHHTDLHERMSILNAYFFPGGSYDGLYQRISPVNSFRVVLKTFFGAKLELLPDRSFFSTWTEPYHFIDVTAQVRSPQE